MFQRRLLSVLETVTGARSIFNSCKSNRFTDLAFPSVPLLVLALAQFVSADGGVQSCQREQGAVEGVGQSEQRRSGLDFSICF